MQCIAVSCSVLHGKLDGVHKSFEHTAELLQSAVVCCSVVQCVVVCCSVLQCVAVCCSVLHGKLSNVQ